MKWDEMDLQVNMDLLNVIHIIQNRSPPVCGLLQGLECCRLNWWEFSVPLISRCRLLEELVQKEKEYQQVLKQNLQQRAQDLELFRLKNQPAPALSALLLRYTILFPIKQADKDVTSSFHYLEVMGGGG